MSTEVFSIHGALGLKTDAFDRGIKSVNSNIDRVTEKLGGAEGISRKFAFGLAAVGAAAFGVATKSVLTAARTETLGVAMKAVARATGTSWEALQKQEAVMKKQGITTQEARTILTRFMQSQLDVADASKIARVAQDLAVISGENSSQTAATLSEAIANQNVLMLRQYGIVVNADDIFTKYAETLGKSADDLTQVEKKQAFVNEIMEAGTKVAGAYDDAMGTAGKKLTSLPRFFEEAENAIGNVFLPTFGTLIDSLTEFLKKITPENIEIFKNKLVELEPVLATVATLVLLTLIPAIKDGIDVLLAMGVAAWESIGPWGIVAAIVIGIITFIIKHWEEVKTIAIGVWESIKMAVGNAVESIKKWFDNTINSIEQAINNTVESIKQAIDNVIKSVLGLIDSIWSGIKSIFNNIVDFVVGVLNSMGETWSERIGFMFGFIASLPIKLAALIYLALSKITEFIGNILIEIGKLINKIINWFTNLIIEIGKLPKKIMDLFADLIIGIVNKVISIDWVDVFNKIKDGAISVFNSIWGFFAGIYNKIKSFIFDTDWKKIFSSLLDGAKRTFDSLLESAKNIFRKIPGVLSDMLTGAFNIGKSVANSIIGFIEGAIKGAISGIPGLGGFSQRFHIPRFAQGVENFSGGLAMVGERGAELINLPRGSDVIPNNKLAFQPAEIHIHAGTIIANDYAIREFGRRIKQEAQRDMELRGGI